MNRKSTKITAICFALLVSISALLPMSAGAEKISSKTGQTQTTKSETKATQKASTTDKKEDTSSSKVEKDTSSKSDKDTKKDTASKKTEEPTKDDSKDNAIAISNESVDTKKFVTNGGAFLWFLLSVVVNAIISFAISYRFHKIAKKDSRVLSEVRALKKDIDAKMQQTIGGFNEYETKVTNQNKSYAKKDSSIKSEEIKVSNEEADEKYRRWEAKLDGKVTEPIIDESKSDLEQIASDIRLNEKQPILHTPSGIGKHSKKTADEHENESNGGVFGKVKNVVNNFLPFEDK